MATQKTVDTRAMLAAGESGQAGIRAASELQSREADASRRQTLELAESVGGALRQESQFQRQLGQDEARLAEQVRSNRMGEAMQQDAQDIEMAHKGLESKGSSRADRLRQDMDRGAQQTGAGGEQQQQNPEDQAEAARFQQQSQQPLEVAGPDTRTIAPTEARQAEKGSKLTTNRMNAQANYLNAVRNLQEAKLKGDKDSLKKETQNLQQPIKEAARMFDAGKKGDLSESQWGDLKSLAEGNPDQQLQQELASKKFGPATGRFLQARVSQSAIQFMAVTGDMPDGDLVDLASPAMRQFTQSAEQMQAYLRAADAGGLLTSSLGIQSLADRNRMVRKLTAQAMLNAKATPRPSGGSLIPSQGGQRGPSGQQPEPGSSSTVDQRAIRGAAAGAIGGAAAGAPKPAGNVSQGLDRATQLKRSGL
jgi:hypothetical protein